MIILGLLFLTLESAKSCKVSQNLELHLLRLIKLLLVQASLKFLIDLGIKHLEDVNGILEKPVFLHKA